MLRGRFDDLEPDDARLNSGQAGPSVDLDAPHAFGLDEDRVLERASVVAGALRGDPQPGLAGEQNRSAALRRGEAWCGTAGRGQVVFSASRRVALACAIAARVACVSLSRLSPMKSCVVPS